MQYIVSLITITTWNHLGICMFSVMGYIHAHAKFEIILFSVSLVFQYINA